MGITAGVAIVAGAAVQADANSRAADDQSKAAGFTQGRAMDYAGPSAMEIGQLQQAINVNTTDIARKQKLIDSTDPALLEVGKQTLAMLRGEKGAGTDSMLQAQRQRQRDQLTSSLQSKLGSGYATSTAGIQALNQFDQQTSDLTSQNNAQTLNSYLGLTKNINDSASPMSNIQASNSIAQLRGGISQRQTNAWTGTSGAVINNAGSGNLSQMYGGQALSALGSYGMMNNISSPASTNTSGTSTRNIKAIE